MFCHVNWQILERRVRACWEKRLEIRDYSINNSWEKDCLHCIIRDRMLLLYFAKYVLMVRKEYALLIPVKWASMLIFFR